MGLADLAAESGTVEVKVGGHLVTFNVPLGDEGKELFEDMILFDNLGQDDSADVRVKLRAERGTELLGKWSPRLIDGADKLEPDQLAHVVKRIGFYRAVSTLRKCAGMGGVFDDLSPDRS